MAAQRQRLIQQAALQPYVVDLRQQTAGAVAAAHRQHDVGQRLELRQSVEFGEAFGVGAGETLKAAADGFQIIDLMARRAQPFNAAPGGRLIVTISGGRNEMNGTRNHKAIPAVSGRLTGR